MVAWYVMCDVFKSWHLDLACCIHRNGNWGAWLQICTFLSQGMTLSLLRLTEHWASGSEHPRYGYTADTPRSKRKRELQWLRVYQRRRHRIPRTGRCLVWPRPACSCLVQGNHSICCHQRHLVDRTPRQAHNSALKIKPSNI